MMHDLTTDFGCQLHGFVVGSGIKKNHFIRHLSAPNDQRNDSEFNVPAEQDNTLKRGTHGFLFCSKAIKPVPHDVNK